MFFLWFKRIFIFLLLLLFKRRRNDDIVKQLTRNNRKRKQLVTVPGITDALDEIVTPLKDFSADTTFNCFNKDGCVLTARTHRKASRVVDIVTVDLPGIGRYRYSNTTTNNNQIGLKLEMVEPMQKWRIKFRGMMNDVQSTNSEESVYVTVVLYWICNADPWDHCSCVPSWTLAKCFDETALADVLHQVLSSDSVPVFYEQWGDVTGRVVIDGQPDTEVIGWKSSRNRIFDDETAPHFDTLISRHIYIDDDGTKLVLGALQNRSKMQRKFGYLTFPIGERWATEISEITVDHGGRNTPDLASKCTISACGMSFHLSNEAERVGVDGDLFGEESETHFIQFIVNGKQAYGVGLRRCGQIRTSSPPLPTVSFKTITATDNSVNLKDGPYCSSDVGGKASKLSILIQEGQNVPSAICLTTEAFKRHVSSNLELRKAIEAIKECVEQKRIGKLSDICWNAANNCIKTDIDGGIIRSVKMSLVELIGNGDSNSSVAVRSSGVNEDGECTSYAGQLETFLGISGSSNILHSIKQCWASNLSYRAVEYRRQLGQPLVDDIGVLIQLMVDADVAGVLFSNDPLTGNPSKMIINASYGLGDNVVSGKVIPDTFRVKRKGGGNILVIEEMVVGEKHVTLHLQKDCGIGTDAKELAFAKDKPCLTESAVMDLCRIGIEIEGILGHGQDIEWAITDNMVHILQSRPIPFMETEGDEDMYHEFDTGYLGDMDCYTLANVGEVLPGARTPLYFSVMNRTAEIGFNYRAEVATSAYHSRYSHTGLGIFYYRIFINLTTHLLKTNTLPGSNKDNAEIALVGQPVRKHKQRAILVLQGRRPSLFIRMVGAFRHYFIEMQRQPRRFKAWSSEVERFTIGEDCTTTASLYDAIDTSLPYLIETWRMNSYMTEEPSTWCGFIMLMLRGDRESTEQDALSDMSILLSECDNVESADVPSALTRLAEAISASEIKDEFLHSTDEQNHVLLINTADKDLRVLYQDFLRRHGHRSISEFDFSSKSWEMEPSLLVHQLKLILKLTAPVPKKERFTINEAVDSLQSPLKFFQKFMLKTFLVRKARDGVAARERGKSVLIKTFNVFKKAYWRLGDMMVRQGYLPDEKLLFFLTHREIGKLIEDATSSLILRAKRRMHIKPVLESMQFPYLNFSRPIPFKVTTESISNKLMKGLPVGRGVATGRACVMMAVEDADDLEEGDILICPYTDIGWTPFFPIIAGVVTELGGLISHGAVIAREFGLPCVANVQGATMVFKTGDKVKVDGLAGTVERLDKCWTNDGRMMDELWTNDGQMMDEGWTNAGQMLDK